MFKLILWLSLAIPRQYFCDTGGPDVDTLQLDDFQYLTSHHLCYTVEHHYWNQNTLIRIETINRDSGIITITQLGKGKPTLDQVHCNG